MQQTYRRAGTTGRGGLAFLRVGAPLLATVVLGWLGLAGFAQASRDSSISRKSRGDGHAPLSDLLELSLPPPSSF